MQSGFIARGHSVDVDASCDEYLAVLSAVYLCSNVKSGHLGIVHRVDVGASRNKSLDALCFFSCCCDEKSVLT